MVSSMPARDLMLRNCVCVCSLHVCTIYIYTHLYIYTYIYIYIYTCACVHSQLCLCICKFMCTHINTRVCERVYASTTQTGTWLAEAWGFVRGRVYVKPECMCVIPNIGRLYVHVHAYVCMHTLVHMYTMMMYKYMYMWCVWVRKSTQYMLHLIKPCKIFGKCTPLNMHLIKGW